MQEHLSDRDCPFCESTLRRDANFILKEKKCETTKIHRELLDSLQLSQCLDCGILYWSKSLSEDYLKKLYINSYRSAKSMGSEDRIVSNHSKAYLFYKNIAPYIKKEDSILDLGCADGFLVDYLSRKGYKAKGLDLNLLSVQISQYNGLDVLMGDIDSVKDDVKFDFIFTSGYFEHLFNPIKNIDIIRDRLSDGGHIYIGTPDLEQPNRAELSDFFPPEHLQTFNKEQLDTFMGMNGFEPVKSDKDVLNIGMYTIYKKISSFRHGKAIDIFDLDKYYDDFINESDRFIVHQIKKYKEEGKMYENKACFTLEANKLLGLIGRNSFVDLYYALKKEVEA